MPTAFPEDLIDVVIAADAVRRAALGMSPVRYRPAQRITIEPFFNVLGTAWGSLMRHLPWVLRKPLDTWICQKLAGHAAEDNPELAERIRQSVELAQRLQRETGRWPAVFIFTSHPVTEGPLQWLRFELLRQGIVIADALVDAQTPGRLFRRHAECFLAIDPYALDTVSPAVGGFYAAWMHRTYLAWDRQPSTQSWVQKHVLLRGSAYPEIAWRLLDRLRRGVPVLMVLSGGLPHNARLLYCAREFIQRLHLKKWPIPKIAAEKQFMEILMQPVDGLRPAEDGTIPESTRIRCRALLESLGLIGNALETHWNQFVDEFHQAVPNRERLFRALKRRLVDRGTPVLLLAISHRDRSPHVRISEPCELNEATAGFVQGRF